MIESAEIERMSVAERLRAIEDIWDSLSRHVEQVDSPDWHGEVLIDRKTRAERGEAKFLTLDELRSRLRNSQ
jgi:putative addiction module component (TIGR02574 family)